MTNSEEKKPKLPIKRLGYYWKDGKKYVAVTEVLSVLAKNGLVPWAIKETARAIAENPDIISNEKDVISAVYGIRDTAGARGKLIHSLLEILKNKQTLPSSIPEKYMGYVNALKSWWVSSEPEILTLEKELFSDKFLFAGTCDCICNIGNVRWLLDMKTGKDIYSEYKMQISAYRQALSENGASVEKAGIVLLKEDGSFVFAEMQEEKEAFKAFLNALELWRFLNEKKEVSNGKSSELGKEAE